MAADDRGGALARWAPGLLLATLLLLTGVATYATAARLHDRERDQLTEDAQEATAAIDRRMNDYGQILRGAAGLYNASDNVTYTDFHNYFADQDVARRFPGFQAIAFASYVPRAGLPAHVRRARRDIAASGLAYPPFRPYPPLKPTDQEALVIDHLEPPPGTNRAFGFNLLSEANRRRAALLARRTGEPAVTAPISLVNTPGSSLGIDLMVPVYGGPPSQTGAPREWTGVVFAAFRMDNLLRGVLGAGAGGADLEIYDVGPAATVPEGTGITRSAVAFDLRPGRATAARDADHTRIRSLEVAGRRWAIAYTRAGTTLSDGERAVPWVIAVAGVLVSLLAA
ncbi:MAG TPA: CHASE domain-containing protein, partial [Baekduia sp.]|nr:CHASE domain-containing protein [Baekduia sp.]